MLHSDKFLLRTILYFVCLHDYNKCAGFGQMHARKKKPSMERFSDALVGLLLLASLLALLSRWKDVTKKREKAPPEAGRAWPIIGHLHLMTRSKSPHQMLGAMADKFGPIFTIRLGMQRIVVISNADIAKECFTKNDLAISSRPRSVALDNLSYNYAMFGFAQYSPYWRELRKIATLELLSNKRIEDLKHVRVSETLSFIRDLYDSSRATSLEGTVSPVTIDMKECFGKLTFNIILQMVVGKRYVDRYSHSGSQADNDTTDTVVYRKSLREFFRLMGLFLVADAFPFLRIFDIGRHEKEMKFTAKERDRIADQWLAEHKNKMGSVDFMGVMMSILEDTHIDGFDKDTINNATCFGLIAGGGDTTSTALVWTLALLLNNPQVLQKAQEELDFHIGKDRLVNESDINNLDYLKAVVKESLRLHPPGPLGTYRVLREDCSISGYHIPKGTNLLVNAWKIQNDPNIWPDPSEFRPERFLTSHKDVDIRGLHHELLPFGSGRRVCPGITLALQVLHLVLAMFLHAFDVRNATDGPVDMSESYGFTSIKATPLEVVLTPRLPSHLYEPCP